MHFVESSRGVSIRAKISSKDLQAPSNIKFGETGEDRACQRRRTSAFKGRATSRVLKMELKELEASQRREALGWDVLYPFWVQ
jgi:hypothetical protein